MTVDRGTGTPFRLGYRPALDGVRGIGILAVMAYHSGLLAGGWLGVDLFFTLSGFLITTLLVEERDRTGKVVLTHFYARRALRLLPALLLCVVLVTTVYFTRWPVTAWPYWGLRVAAVVFYIGNWTEIRGISLGMLGHTWSLSIEEQFYLLWPLTLAVLLAIVPRRATASALVVMLAAAAFMSRVALTVAGRSPWRVYLGTDTHGDGLLVGCAAALLASAALPLRSPFATRVLRAVTPAAALGVGWLLLVSHWPGDYLASASSVANVLVAVVLLDVCAGPSLLGRLLARSGLVAVGRISYGLYLFHFPVFKMLGMLVMPDGSGRGSPLLIATGWLVAFAIAGLSFRYVERPALAFKGRVRGGQPIPASVVSRLADGRLA